MNPIQKHPTFKDLFNIPSHPPPPNLLLGLLCGLSSGFLPKILCIYFPLLCAPCPSNKTKRAKIIRSSVSFSFRPAIRSTCFSKSCHSQRYSDTILQYFASWIEHQSVLWSHETKSMKMQGWFQTEFGKKPPTSSCNIHTTKAETPAAHFSCEFFERWWTFPVKVLC